MIYTSDANEFDDENADHEVGNTVVWNDDVPDEVAWRLLTSLTQTTHTESC